ncbi:exocyst complex component EXO70B1-like [Prosopis cineraria]|uniref:exocyst complex component EXO70B1-like n=1 Tax=Prosopis cineraria TaxID=364024 RepID=UPI00240F81C2|nr:exocyst complex component EXO70B1-like [Prosopis cineraria]
MEKNLTESGSCARIDEKKNESETPRAPLPDSGETDAKEVEAKTDDDAKPLDADTESEPAVEKEEEDAPIEVAESPPPSLKNISGDVDQYLETLTKNADVEEPSLEIPDFIDQFLVLVEEKISLYDSGGSKGKWGEAVEEDSSLLGALHRISKLMKLLSQSETSSEEISTRKDLLVNHIGTLQHRAMSYFEEEFRFLMEESRNPGESDAGGHGKQVEQDRNQLSEPEFIELEPEFPSYPDEIVAKLKQITKEMTSVGFQHECGQIYSICRSCTLEENLQKIGFEKMSIDEILRMQWKILERDIPAWIKTFKDFVSVYLAGEQKLAESVFEENPSLSVILYSDLSRCIVMQLLNFAEGVAMTKRAAEKLFKTLDMYETLRDAIPSFEELLPEEYANELKTETTLTKSRLGENVISTFGDLENAIKTDAEKTLVPGGAVHPLTRYFMNYLPFACEYKETLEQVFKEHSKIERADSTSRPHYDGDGNSQQNVNANNTGTEQETPFAAQVIRLMSHLDTNLEGKAKLYRDVALSCIFMMNNGRYMLQKIKGSREMYSLMGETWCRKRSSDLRSYHKNYVRETWSKILNCLTPEGLSSHGKVQKPVLKERFKSFNAIFDEIHRTQSTWIVNDEQLQSELRVSITGVVIPAYRAFLGRYSQYLDPGRQTEKYIKYQADDIETLIDELFDGTNPARRRP